MVDICDLNKVALIDVYPMPLQTDITSAVAGCKYITKVDATSFFHQSRVKQEDGYKLPIVSHRGREQYNVALMGFKYAPTYAQR